MTLLVQDLEYSLELDCSAREAVCGGFDTLFNWDQLLSDINNGGLTSGVDVAASGNFLSPIIVTNVPLNLQVNTVVQVDLDEIVNTEQIIASNFGGGTP